MVSEAERSAAPSLLILAELAGKRVVLLHAASVTPNTSSLGALESSSYFVSFTINPKKKEAIAAAIP